MQRRGEVAILRYVYRAGSVRRRAACRAPAVAIVPPACPLQCVPPCCCASCAPTGRVTYQPAVNFSAPICSPQSCLWPPQWRAPRRRLPTSCSTCCPSWRTAGTTALPRFRRISGELRPALPQIGVPGWPLLHWEALLVLSSMQHPTLGLMPSPSPVSLALRLLQAANNGTGGGGRGVGGGDEPGGRWAGCGGPSQAGDRSCVGSTLGVWACYGPMCRRAALVPPPSGMSPSGMSPSGMFAAFPFSFNVPQKPMRHKRSGDEAPHGPNTSSTASCGLVPARRPAGAAGTGQYAQPSHPPPVLRAGEKVGYRGHRGQGDGGYCGAWRRGLVWGKATERGLGQSDGD